MLSEKLNFLNALTNRSSLKNTYKTVHTGVGKVNMAATLSSELSVNVYYDLVAVVGYAAGSSVYSQGDLVIPSVARYHDAVCPPSLVEELTRTYSLEGNDDTVVLTGDSFVTRDLALSLIAKYGKYSIFDMESTAAAQVLSDYNIPLLVMKIISDVPTIHNLQSFESFVDSHKDFSCFLNYLENLS